MNWTCLLVCLDGWVNFETKLEKSREGFFFFVFFFKKKNSVRNAHTGWIKQTISQHRQSHHRRCRRQHHRHHHYQYCCSLLLQNLKKRLSPRHFLKDSILNHHKQGKQAKSWTPAVKRTRKPAIIRRPNLEKMIISIVINKNNRNSAGRGLKIVTPPAAAAAIIRLAMRTKSMLIFAIAAKAQTAMTMNTAARTIGPSISYSFSSKK